MASLSPTSNDLTLSPRLTQCIVGAIYALSGAAGLMHEVSWTRLLRHVMGNTTWAIATVLCVFMAGLAFGGWLAGRHAEPQHRPLRSFAILEVGIALYCLLLPSLVQAGEPVLRHVYQSSPSMLFGVTRFLFCVLILAVPATMMGATLPLVSACFSKTGRGAGFSAGAAYAANTLGACVGVLVAGLFLLPEAGLSLTIQFACLLNLVASLLGYLLFQRTENDVDTTATFKDSQQTLPATSGEHSAESGLDFISSRTMFVLLIGFALSGTASLVYEITWTRTISLIIGSSVHAFTLMLATFILGLGIGGLLCCRIADRISDPLKILELFSCL